MNDNVTTSDQIPDDPLNMPPPYWRSGGVIFHLLDALENLPNLLSRLVTVHEQTEIELQEYFEQHPEEPNEDDELEEFGEICNDLWELEHKIKLSTELAIFMSAIQAEEIINRFCVFNLHKDIAESIETLSPAEKLLVASAVIGEKRAKGTAVYEASKKLSSWRNAFAHGHCVDRPTKSLRHNHLISPSQYPGVPDSIAKMKELVGYFLKVEEYLRSISLNPYTATHSAEVEEIQEHLKEISSFRFKVSHDSNDIYDIEYKKT